MSTAATVAAVDLGASSGRVMVGRIGEDSLTLDEVHRFRNGGVRVGGTLYWDVLDLYRETLEGIRRAAAAEPRLASIGIDSWAVDYALLDSAGAMVGNPVHYRDGRTAGVSERVLKTVPAEELYRITGIQQLPFNTIYQLVAALDSPQRRVAETLLLVPDLLGYWLTGQIGAEATNASTTQLFDARLRSWASGLAEQVGIPPTLLPPVREPGEVIGELLPDVTAELGLPAPLPVIAVGSHDTASAVVGVPAAGPAFAYVATGTWSLVGVELREPVLTEDARKANFTNEAGVDGTVRFLRNAMGLWLLQECERVWSRAGGAPVLAELLSAAAAEPAFRAVVDPDDPAFLPPGDMPARIAQFCRRTGQPVPSTPAAVTRCVLESLALAHRRGVRAARQLSGQAVDVVHLVGGGSRNELLCQLTADACGLPVLAGPVEASAFGNVLVQARTLGVPLPDLAAMRALLARAQPVRRYEPGGNAAAWRAAEERVFAAA